MALLTPTPTRQTAQAALAGAASINSGAGSFAHDIRVEGGSLATVTGVLAAFQRHLTAFSCRVTLHLAGVTVGTAYAHGDGTVAPASGGSSTGGPGGTAGQTGGGSSTGGGGRTVIGGGGGGTVRALTPPHCNAVMGTAKPNPDDR